MDNESQNYVLTNLNPANVATQIILPRKFIESELWWHGPQFLLDEKQKWPVRNVTVKHKNLLVEDELKETMVLVAAWVS